MSRSKRGTSYRSFDFLEAGVDYRDFELAPQVGRVPESLVPLDAEQNARFERLLDELVLISLHEHLGVFPADLSQTRDLVREGRMATAFEGLAAGHWDAVFDNLMDGICTIHSSGGWKWTEVLHDLGMRLCDLAHQEFVFHATRVDDLLRAHAEDRVAWIASMEGAAMIENELDRIDQLYGFGVRALGITYSESNALGSGLREPRDGGLTVFGRRAVERMNKVGMLIDCSHCGDLTTLDTIEASEHPIVLSHIGARALWDSNRLAPDDVLVACAEKGGVIGIEAAPHTTLTPTHPRHSIESFMEHFEHVVRLVGIDHVAFGPDTLYGDHVGLHQAYAANLSIDRSRASSGGAAPAAGSTTSSPPPFERVPWVEGLENPTEGSRNILRWLVAHGYTDDDIGKAMGGNVLRVLRQVWA
ncbi:MAG TPA: membrane dipeptidase [Thermoanaerobaculia bacterium]|nr:membrane dipeptidase [Thermoanaerobaculia bacterium]